MTIKVSYGSKFKIFKNCGYYTGTHAKDEISPGQSILKFHAPDMLTITTGEADKARIIAIFSPGTNWIVEFV